MSKKVLLVIASKEFQPVEYGKTKEVLEDNNIEVITASDASGQAYATDGSVVHINLTLDEIDMSLFDGIFLIGGGGAMKYLDTGVMYNLLRTAQRESRAYGAICISPRILAAAGVLNGKKATGWDSDDKLTEVFKKHNVDYVKEPVVVDGNLVTAVDPKAAEKFGKAIVKIL